MPHRGASTRAKLPPMTEAAQPYRSPAEAVGAEVSRLAAQVRVAWWEALGSVRHHVAPRREDEIDAELVRLEAVPSLLPPVADPQLDEVRARLEEHRRRGARDRMASSP